MKYYLQALMFLLTPILLIAQEDPGLAIPNSDRYFVVGDRVNVRKQPSSDGEVLFQAHWGYAYWGKTADQNWIRIISHDEADFYYVYADYIVKQDAFIKRGLSQKQKSGNTYYELINFYDKEKNFGKVETLTKELLSRDVESRIMIRAEGCLDVDYYAYQLLTDYYFKNDQVQKVKALGSLKEDKKLSVWIELDLVRWSILNNDLEVGKKLIKKLFEYPPDLFYIDTGCEYDAFARSAPLIDLKNLCINIFTLLEDYQKIPFRTEIEQIAARSTFEEHKKTAKEIIHKMKEGIWER